MLTVRGWLMARGPMPIARMQNLLQIRRQESTSSASTTTLSSDSVLPAVSSISSENVPLCNQPKSNHQQLTRLGLDDPRVEKLFRPYILLDFLPVREEPGAGIDAAPKVIPPAVNLDELRELRLQARLFGLDPTRDLALPTVSQVERIMAKLKEQATVLAKDESPATVPIAVDLTRVNESTLREWSLQKPQTGNQSQMKASRDYLDPRLADELARMEDKRRRRDEKRAERDEKQKVKLVMRGKWDQLKTILDQEAEKREREETEAEMMAATGQKKKEFMPLRMRPLAEQAAYKQQKEKMVEQLVAGMDDRIAEWKQKRRENRRKTKESAPPF